MTDLEIAGTIKKLYANSMDGKLFKIGTITLSKNGMVDVAPDKVSEYYLRKHNLVAVDIPPLDEDERIAIAQIALAVGRRLERLERALKSNASRTAETRQKVAQNAIQSRWSAK